MIEQSVINLHYYDGLDRYSDGEIEESIIKRLEDGETATEILRKEDEWPILYHFSPKRKNLLSWYPFKKGASMLEVGAGWGAMTALFLECGLETTAVEFSERRSRINYLRHKNFENWHIYVGDLNDMHFEKPFDYASLIGVLEYAGQYSDSKDPYLSMLTGVNKRLKDNGTLFLAIENPSGMKYFAGASEDHAGRPFVSIEGYKAYSADDEPGRTFDKEKLREMLSNAGFESCDFYYPMPDYKLAECVVNHDAKDLFKLSCIASINYEKSAWRAFDEKKALENAASNKKFDIFCNSFLILAHKGCGA